MKSPKTLIVKYYPYLIINLVLSCVATSIIAGVADNYKWAYIGLGIFTALCVVEYFIDRKGKIKTREVIKNEDGS